MKRPTYEAPGSRWVGNTPPCWAWCRTDAQDSESEDAESSPSLDSEDEEGETTTAGRCDLSIWKMWNSFSNQTPIVSRAFRKPLPGRFLLDFQGSFEGSTVCRERSPWIASSNPLCEVKPPRWARYYSLCWRAKFVSWRNG